jgi:hypothetical protein
MSYSLLVVTITSCYNLLVSSYYNARFPRQYNDRCTLPFDKLFL